MRVALVCPYDLGRPGGVQDQVLKLATWLADDGHHAVVVAPGTEVPEGLDPDHAEMLGRSVLVRANRSAAPIAVSPRTVASVRQAVKTHRVEVVHIHEPFMPVVGPAALMGLDLPKVATFHSDPSTLIRRTYRLAAPLVARMLRGAGTVTAVSPVAASALRGVAVSIVPNGLDVDAYRRVETERRPHRVVFVGRDEPRKGLTDLLTAWPQVRRRIPDAELLVVGTTAPATGSPVGVRFLGRVSEHDKRMALAGSAVLCAPNTGGESFGIILVEAMAAGCVVVATGLPGFVHVLGDAGEFVAPGDPDGLAARLGDVLIDGEHHAILADRSAIRVGEFDRRVVLDGYLAAYERAAAGG